MNLQETPVMTWENIKGMEDLTWFTHALIFDDLLVVSQKETCCFVWKTQAGLVVIDGIWPDEKVYHAIIAAIEDVGWDSKDIKKYVITHGHVDHAGCGKWLATNHQATTYLSKVDTLYWEEHPTKPERPETWKDFDIDVYVSDKDIIDCGDKKIQVYETPGHTPGCLSYIFPVHEGENEYMAALFGGATPPFGDDEAGKRQYLQSVEKFRHVVEVQKVEVMLSNHTIFDNGLERIQYAQKRYSYMPNIYVLGVQGVLDFMKLYECLGQKSLEK